MEWADLIAAALPVMLKGALYTLMFAVVALLPGMLVFTVSAQFLTRSIESWFNVQVETALDRGLELGKNALGYVLTDVSRKARVISRSSTTMPATATPGWPRFWPPAG